MMEGLKNADDGEDDDDDEVGSVQGLAISSYWITGGRR